jgi:aspartate/methionine/tyrosine aminotransferase
MDVMEAADRLEREGERVLHLEVGQPGTPAPKAVRDAAHAALDGANLGYSRATGTPALRKKIATHYEDTYGVQVDPGRIVVTTGASGAFVLAFTAAFDAGARVAVTVPGYPCYPNILTALDIVPLSIRVGTETGYQPTVEHLKSLEHKPDGLILASPANPTGSMLSPERLRELLTYCRAESILVIVDEIYQGLTFGGAESNTAAEFSDSVIVINSFSKYFSMTGWRLGWMVLPESFIRTAEILSQNLVICPPTLSQEAAVSAFDARKELEAHVERYGRNRTLLLNALREAGVEKMAPADGAFYIYADLSQWTDDSVNFCEEMLAEIGVAATSGVDFDPEGGNTMVRFSYCRGEGDVAEAMALFASRPRQNKIRSALSIPSHVRNPTISAFTNSHA